MQEKAVFFIAFFALVDNDVKLLESACGAAPPPAGGGAVLTTSCAVPLSLPPPLSSTWLHFCSSPPGQHMTFDI